MEMKNMPTNDTNEENRNNADTEDQVNNNLNLGDAEAAKKKLLPFSMKIKRFKNKYYQRSIYSIIFIITACVATFFTFYGIDILFDIFSKYGALDKSNNEFEVRPKISGQNLIQINSNNWEPLFGDLKHYLSQKSSKNCKTNPNFNCFLQTETQNSQCSEGHTYGLKYGDPCILIDMKPVSKWITSNTTVDSRIHLKCDGEKVVDKESVGPINYFPRNGVPIEYFMSNDTSTPSPFLFVHLSRPANGVVFFVECHVFSESSEQMTVLDIKPVKFEIIIEN